MLNAVQIKILLGFPDQVRHHQLQTEPGRYLLIYTRGSGVSGTAPQKRHLLGM